MRRAAILTLVLLFSRLCRSEPFCPGDAVRDDVRIFYFSGSPGEIGLRHGRRLKEEIHWLCREYLGKFIKITGGVASKTAALAAASQLEIPQPMEEEMRAIAEGSGLPYMEILLANTVFDTKKIFQCTTVAAKGRGRFFARNLDFPSLGTLHKHSVVFSLPGKGKSRMALMSFPGYVGALNGINSHGLSCAVMEVSNKPYRSNEPYAFAFRRMLASCKTVDEAYAFLKENPTTTGNNLMVCDARGETAVLEITPGRCRLRKSEGEYIYATNHFLSENPRGHRISIIEKLLRGDPKPSFNLARKLLVRTSAGGGTIRSTITYPVRKTVYLSSGSLPASKGPYTALGAPVLGLGVVPGRAKAFVTGVDEDFKRALYKLCKFDKVCKLDIDPLKFSEAPDHRFGGKPESYFQRCKPEDVLVFGLTGPAASCGTALRRLAEKVTGVPSLTVTLIEKPAGCKEVHFFTKAFDITFRVIRPEAGEGGLFEALAAVLSRRLESDLDEDGQVTLYEVLKTAERALFGFAQEAETSFTGKALAKAVVVFKTKPDG